jgi:prepilin-type N-terminal cleavage/methylation domain-containing protein
MKSVSKDPRGFTLVEVLVAAGLMGVLALVLATAVEQGFLGFKSVDNRQSMASQLQDLRMKLGKQNICTGNLKGKVLGLNTPIAIHQLNHYDPAQQMTGEVLFSLAQELAKVTGPSVTRLELVPKTKVSKTFYIAEVQIDYQIKGKAIGPDLMTRSFALAVSVDSSDNKIVHCGAMDETVISEDRICSVSSGGRNYFDPVSGTCKSRYKDQCFMGSGSSASCPAGWTIAPAGSQDCAQTSDSLTLSGIREYTDGGTDAYRPPPPYRFRQTAVSSGTCAWAKDQDYSTWTCGVRCEQLVYF